MFFLIALCLLANSAFAGTSTELRASSQASAPYSLELSAKEKAWLARHKTIRVAFDDSLPPYSFVDQSGKFNGIAVDIFNALSQKLPIRFEHQPRKSWNQIYRAVAERRTDVVATMVDRPERRLLFNFTHPYLTKSLAIITRENDTAIKTPSDLAGKTVAYVLNYQYGEGIKKNHPNIKPHAVKSMLECLQAVSAKKSDACITFVGTASYLQTQHPLKGIKFAGFYERRTADESIAVRGDWPILAGIMQKGLDALSEAEMNAIYFKWVPPPSPPPVTAKESAAQESVVHTIKTVPVPPRHEENYWLSAWPLLLVLGVVGLWTLRVRLHHRHPVPPPQNPPSPDTQTVTASPNDFEEMLLKRATELKNRDTRFRNLIENQSKNYFFFQCDKQSKITYVSPSVTAILGYKPEKFITDFQSRITDHPENIRISRLLELCRQGKPCPPYALEVYDSHNERRWLEITSEPVYDEFGNCVGVDCLVFEITKRKQEDERLIWLSFHDELTGLANRRMLVDHLQQAITMAHRTRMSLALLFLDLDGFKSVNDKMGHAAGDYALKEVAIKLSGIVRDSDTAARLGGDEFALLLPDGDETAAAAVAKKIVNKLNEPIAYGETAIQFGVSIGIALYPRHGTDCDTLLHYADASMYYAKQKRLGFSFQAGT
ncbi:diguanylate cyclase domain-containing protein [Methylomicrobium lacus]|uniref:diguanylate cyclase domain-containing protein n=1 Tax=Methylomicrobium lacus TaxID=136992 RepID=UPI0035A8BBCC